MYAALAIGALQMLLAACLSFVLHAAFAIGALQMLLAACLSFVLHATFAIGALQMLLATCLSLFVCCSCHRDFADAFGHMFEFLFYTLLSPSGLRRCLFVSCLNLFCMLLLPSGFCRCFVPCLNFVLQAAVAIGALHLLGCDMF